MKEKPKNKTKQIKSKSKHQNGKGSAPRNISEKFKNNYEYINWNKNKK
jgi:hypothetical protein